MTTNSVVQVNIVGGPTIANLPWSQGMNAQQALEEAYNQVGRPQIFTYALQYYGGFGYLVMMINETYDSFISSAAPFYYWQFLVNGQPPQTGIDGTVLNAGDTISFEFVLYNPSQHAGTMLEAKHQFQAAQISGASNP